MPTNIESFVKTLESEGVDAGRKAAKKIEAEANEKAASIVAAAKEKAEQIVAEAQSEAEKIKARMNSSLELATRDGIYLLREKLGEQLKVILKLNVEKALNDEETLSHVLREVIPAYANTPRPTLRARSLPRSTSLRTSRADFWKVRSESFRVRSKSKTSRSMPNMVWPRPGSNTKSKAQPWR